MAALNQSPEAITPEFAPKETYKKLFALREETWPHLFEIGKRVAAACQTMSEPERAKERALKVICLGYGEGWRDLPVLLGLLEQGWSCDVVAIEPTWNNAEGAAKQFARSFCETQHLPYCVSGSSESDDQFIIKSVSDAARTCTIRVFNGTGEKWLEERGRYDGTNSVDIVLAMCVLHLLSDWKATLGWFLDDALKPGGCLVAGETPGSISAFDGDFRRLHGDDPWHRAWRRYYQERARQLLPTAKAVSPKNMYILREALELSEYTRLDPTCTDLKDGGPFCEKAEGVCKCGWTAYEHCTTDASALGEVLNSSKHGPDAKTLGAFMVYDKVRAEELVDCLEKSAWPKSEGDEFSYRASYRYIAYRKPGAERVESRKIGFPAAVASVADNHAVSNAIEIKTSVKKTLNEFVRKIIENPDINSRGTELTKRRRYALGSVLFDMREMLCLSRDTFAVATSRVKRNYLSAVHLLPLSIVGRQQGKPERAKVLVAQHGSYLSAPANQHINVLADEENVHDLSIVIVRGGERLTVVPYFSADGNVCHLLAEIPETKWNQWATERGSDAVSGEHHTVTYSDYETEEGFTSFQTEVTFNRSGDRTSLDPDDELAGEIKRALKDRHPVLVRPLALALTNARRLAMLHWFRNSDREVSSWKACLYVMRRLVVDDETSDSGFAHVGVALLSLLSADDYDAWIKPENDAKQNFPRLVMAIEPYLSAIAEIEVMGHLEDQLKVARRCAFDAIKYAATQGNWFVEQPPGNVSHNFNEANWNILVGSIDSLAGDCGSVAQQLKQVDEEDQKKMIFESFKHWLLRDKPLSHSSIALICWLAGDPKERQMLVEIAADNTRAKTRTSFKKRPLGVASQDKGRLTKQLHDVFRIIQIEDGKHSEALDTSKTFHLSFQVDSEWDADGKWSICIQPPWKQNAIEEAKNVTDITGGAGNLRQAMDAVRELIDISFCTNGMLIK